MNNINLSYNFTGSNNALMNADLKKTRDRDLTCLMQSNLFPSPNFPVTELKLKSLEGVWNKYNLLEHKCIEAGWELENDKRTLQDIYNLASNLSIIEKSIETIGNLKASFIGINILLRQYLETKEPILFWEINDTECQQTLQLELKKYLFDTDKLHSIDSIGREIRRNKIKINIINDSLMTLSAEYKQVCTRMRSISPCSRSWDTKEQKAPQSVIKRCEKHLLIVEKNLKLRKLDVFRFSVSLRKLF